MFERRNCNRTGCRFSVLNNFINVVYLFVFAALVAVVNAQTDIDTSTEKDPFPHEYDKDSSCTRDFCEKYWDTGGTVCTSDSNWGIVYDLNDQLNCTLDVGFTAVFCKEPCCPVKAGDYTTKTKLIILGIAGGVILVMGFCNYLMYMYRDKPVKLVLHRDENQARNTSNNNRNVTDIYDEDYQQQQPQRGLTQQTSSSYAQSSQQQQQVNTDTTTPSSSPLPPFMEDEDVPNNMQPPFNGNNNNGIHQTEANVMDATSSTCSQDPPEFYEDEDIDHSLNNDR